MEALRIQKWLSQMGIASRREAETWISEGRISVNGKVVRELGTKITPGSDQVCVDGKLVVVREPPRVYWLLNKPDEVLTARHSGSKNSTSKNPTPKNSASKDAEQAVEGSEKPDRQTIYDLPKLQRTPFLVSPVGRLDYRTEGLLLLTNDGELANRLCHPKYKVPRLYHVLIKGKLTPEQEQALRSGVTLEDGPTQKVELRYAHGKNLGMSRGSWYAVTVHEGRNRLVRRLFEHFDHKVVRLIRVAFGDIKLPEDLKAGDYIQLNSDQIASLKRSAGLNEKEPTSKPRRT